MSKNDEYEQALAAKVCTNYKRAEDGMPVLCAKPAAWETFQERKTGNQIIAYSCLECGGNSWIGSRSPERGGDVVTRRLRE